jgi:serine/threonine-protein kinase
LPPSTPLRFRVLRPHAKGALGEVFVARDEELHREVALKEIQNQHADDPHRRARFVVEAEITGGLEHPGIVPVYGLGHYPDGRPYYAMRFIRGDGLQEAIDRFHKADVPGRNPRERNLALRDLLGRFVDVCNAMAYAHARGVLHRDLKPGNILLGRYGETLVVDWGLAKPLGRADADTPEGPLQPLSGTESAPTQLGAAIGTPAYMSPEQAAGRLDLLGPASDVYSLGATLYCLLAGRAPFTDVGVAAVLRKVQQGDFPRPGQVKSGVPAALEAICLKALALKPEGRYATPQALAQDVERWLADEPVSAYREPLAARLSRWARQHRVLVTGTAAATAVAVLSLGVGLAVVAGKNQALDAANAELKTAYTQEEAARADTESRRGQAAERLTLALGAFKELVFDVQEQLAKRSGTQDLRKALLHTAVEGLTRLAKYAEKAQDTDRSTAVAYLTLGNIFLQIEGQTERAWHEYERAHSVFKRRAAVAAKDTIAQRDLAASYDKLGDVSLQLGDTKAARRYYQDAPDIAQGRVTADSKNAQAQRDLAISYTKLGDGSRQLDDTQTARRYYQAGLEIAQRLAAADPKDAELQRDLAISYERHGDVSCQLGATPAARRYYQDGLAINQRLAAADPKNPQAQRDLSVSYERLGDVSRAFDTVPFSRMIRPEE